MPINPNVPGDNDYIAEFPTQNRANMQATIEALQALTNTTQDLEAKVDPLHAQATTLLALAAQSAAILGSAIVGHNFDAQNAPNGRFVRWDVGLQVCFAFDFDLHFFSSGPTIQGIDFRQISFTWEFPAIFKDSTSYFANAAHSLIQAESFPYTGPATTRPTSYSASSVTFQTLAMDDTDPPFLTDTTMLFAVGQWK